MIEFSVNKARANLDVDPSTPLLWVIRDHLGLTGTKYGCGIAQCGACTVHIDGQAVRSCVAPVSRAAGKEVTTIEGLSPDLSHPLQRAWIEEDVPQCGYCQSGQLAQPLAHSAGADDRHKKYGCSEAFRREFASERHQRVLAMNSKWDRSGSSPSWREQMHS